MSFAASWYGASCAFLLLALYFSMFSFYPPFLLSLFLSLSLYLSLSLSLSPPSFSLWLQDTCHLMPFTKYPLLNQSYFFTNQNSPTIHRLSFTTTILRAAWKTSSSLSSQPSSSFLQKDHAGIVTELGICGSISIAGARQLQGAAEAIQVRCSCTMPGNFVNGKRV